MNIQTIDYKRVKCPKCGKSYFRVKENSGVSFMTLAFITKPDPIYKDGELQNPTEAEPIKERCKCLECGCNFRAEVHDVFGDYKLIDEDAEIEETKKKLEECSGTLNAKTSDMGSITVGDVNPPKSGTLEFSIHDNQLISPDIRPVVVKYSEEILEEELDKIKERLAKLENKVLGEN